MHALSDLTADGPVLVLNVEVAESSRASRRFIGELTATVIAATTRPPLVYSNDFSLSAIYRAPAGHDSTELRYDDNREFLRGRSVRLADAKSDSAGLIQWEVVSAEDFKATDGAWLKNASPDNTPRFQLAVFDATALCRALDGLVAKLRAARQLVDYVNPHQSQAWEPDHRWLPNTTPARDQDPMVRLAIANSGR